MGFPEKRINIIDEKGNGPVKQPTNQRASSTISMVTMKIGQPY